jgi:RNA polymerase sigma factor (sigma-70 family)
MIGAMTSAEVPLDDDVWGRAATAFASWYDGRPEAIEDLVRVMTPVLWQVARASRLSADDAADVVQAAWLALVRNASTIQDPHAVAAWLITTVRRDAIRRSRAARAIAVDDEVLDALAPVAAPAEDVAVERDEHRRLWRAVRGLTDRCQELLRVVAFERRPDYAAIAERLDMRVGSIGPTRARCLDKLRLALAEATA